jgi:hypothetical protein
VPNGKYNPQCSNCDFFQGGLFPEIETERRWCKKHNFVMPYGGSEFICSDWLHEGKASEYFKGLESGFLYNYSYQSENPPETFRSFDKLQNLIVSAAINQDNELGWVVLLKDEWQSLFPKPDNSVELWFNGTSNAFQVLDIQRSFHAGSMRVDADKWEHRYVTRIQRVLYCPSLSIQVYNWVNELLRVDEYISKTIPFEGSDMLLAIGFFVYLEVVEKHKKYRLIPDTYYYKDLVRV